MKKIINKTSIMKIGKRMLSCFLSFAIAVTMMCGLFVVEAGAENPYTIWIRDNLIGQNAIWDDTYEYSCCNLPRYYLQKYFGKWKAGYGNGKDVYKGVAAAYPDLFERIDYYDGFVPKPGDIISWDADTASNNAYGHVGIVYRQHRTIR